MNTEREYTLTEISEMSAEERLKAISRRAALTEYDEKFSEPTDIEEKPDRVVLHIYLSDEEIGLLYQLLDEKERQARAIIKRNADYPTYNAKAMRSNQKQEQLIARIEYIRAQITDQ